MPKNTRMYWGGADGTPNDVNINLKKSTSGDTPVMTTNITIPPDALPSSTPTPATTSNLPKSTDASDVYFTYGNVSRLQLITIPASINLYYGSQTKSSFDPDDIRLSDGTLLALFSNNPKLSSDVFMNCSNFPNTNGYLHKFLTKKDIPNIQLISSSAIDKNSSLVSLDKQYCQRSDGPKINGFAYAIKRTSGDVNTFDYIIGLCNPNEYVTYVSTNICVNPYRLSDPINIY